MNKTKIFAPAAFEMAERTTGENIEIKTFYE